MATPPNVFVAYLSQKLEAGGSETTIYLDRVTTKTGETIATSDFATFSRGIVTINPDGDGATSYPEYCSFTAVDTSALTLTGVARGLSAKSNSVVTANKRFHPVGTPVVFSFGAHNIQDLIDYIDTADGALSVGTAAVVTGTAGETIAAGELVYLKNDGKWWLCDADTVATLDAVQLGIAQGAGTADAAITNGVMRQGRDANQTGLVAGTTYYASNTAGAVSSSAGTNSKVVGVGKSSTELYFDPKYHALPTTNEKEFISASTGMIVMYGGSSAPTGFLLCDGSAVSRTTYADLFAVTSTSYGVGDGSTTFNLPDLRSSFPIGYGQKTVTFDFVDADVATGTEIITIDSNNYIQTGTALALTTTGTLPTGLSATTYYAIRVSATTIKLATSRANADDGTAVDITAASGGGTHTLTLTMTSRAMGDVGGEETHYLTTSEIPSHTHTIPMGGSNPGTDSVTIDTNVATTTQSTGASGGDSTHNNMPPYVTVNYVIKT